MNWTGEKPRYKYILNGLYRFHVLFVFLQWRQFFMTSCLFSYTPILKRGANSEGSKFFHFKIDPFSEGMQAVLTDLSPLKVYHFLLISHSKVVFKLWPGFSLLTLDLPNPDIPCLCKQCRSRSMGFWRSQLIWICTVCHSVCESISTTLIKKSDWLKIRNGCGFLIYSAGLRWMDTPDRLCCYFAKGELMETKSFL